VKAGPVVHADDGNEYTVCGLAFDAYDSGDAAEPVVMAEEGQVYTCENCRRVIAWHRMFKRHKQPDIGEKTS
jgi:hypothetical protein